MSCEAASHAAVLGAQLKLERSARQQADGERIGDDHDDQRTEERRQGSVDEEVRVEYS